jgi:hypothetical protein
VVHRLVIVSTPEEAGAPVEDADSGPRRCPTCGRELVVIIKAIEIVPG